jgi:ABC transport system ATP-binding/permease protein
MPAPLLLLQDIDLSFGGTPLLEGAALSVGAGERLCLVGRNGSGKSTLMRVAAGLIEADRGERFLQPGTTLRYLPQEPDLDGHASALDYVLGGLGPSDDPHRARLLLERIGLDGATDPALMSGGEARRAALARALAPEPDILLLDEPTNHLDLPAIEWLEQELNGLATALVLISHDRRFLERLSRATLWLDRGTTRRLEQGFAGFEPWRDEVLEQEARDRHKLDRKIVVEEDWLRYGVTGRRKRNQGRLAGLQALRQERRAQRRATGAVAMMVTEAELSGRLVVEAEAVRKTLGDRMLVKDLSIRVQRGDRLGVVGPNGIGKTTVLNLLTGVLAPDAGRIRLGASLEMVALDQRRQSLDAETTLAATLTGGHGETVTVGGRPRHVASYLKDFLFAPERARMSVGALSGGERGRLMLARALARPSNLLVLDEPTNDLDLETLDLLQDMLGDYPGTVLLVSHDRDFLDRVATSILAAEGDGRWIEYAGGYTDMLAQRGERAERKPAAPAPKRAAPAPAPPPKAARKLSFKDKHALETLPGRMEALQAEIADHRAGLADADLYQRNPAEFGRLTAALRAAENELASAEEQWLAAALSEESLKD